MRSDFAEGRQYKSPLRDGGMRQAQSGQTQNHIIEEQEVEVEAARPVRNALAAFASETALDRKQEAEQGLRIKVCFQLRHGVDKSGLLAIAHRLRAVEGGTGDDAASRFEVADGRLDGLLRGTCG